jgi:hypothetical protein
LVAVARQHGIKKAKDNDSIGKLFIPYLRRAEESVLGSVLVQLSLVLAASRQNGANVLREAATLYKVDADAIALKVRQEFAAKDKAKAEKKPPVKTAYPSPALSWPRIRPGPFFGAGRTRFGFSRTLSSLALPASARRLRGRSQVPPPAPFPLLRQWVQ